ncbi:MAG TPA: serine/threonine-protein kinase [Kofleriaceae bacterium]|nr:serine/threonine-protein kinase [Kofleriaceae bacterium]
MSVQRHDQGKEPRGVPPGDPPSPAEAPTVDVASGAPRAVGPGDELPTESMDSFDEILRKVVRTGPPAAPLEVGSELVGRFLITRVLGVGGMGTVYVARDATLGREVAIKVHHVHHTPGSAHRLRREAMAMARLAHPNVVTVFEVGDFQGHPFVVMEYVPGTTLRAWLGAEPRGVREILATVIAAGEGLAAAHDAGLVHRDFKPENVLIGADGRVRVGDFGLARELDSKEHPQVAAGGPADRALDPPLTPVTQTGMVLGTPAYMSPEQYAGRPVDARADQFAFCVTAWEALWGERPFEGASFAELCAAISSGTRRAPPSTPRVPSRVRLALERGLAVDPERRFPTMHALLAAIRPAGRRRWGRALAAGATVALGLAAAWLLTGRAPSCDTAGAAELATMRTDLPALLRRAGQTRIADQSAAVQDRYASGFRGNARRACEAGRSRDWSPDLIAQSRTCFAITARTAALSLAGADLSRPMDVLRRLRRLPPEDQCTNPTHLASRPAIPSDPGQLDEVTSARATLAVGFDAAEDHDFAELGRALDKLAASPARGDPGIAAGMTVLRGWRAFADGQLAETRKLFIDAYYAGRAIDDEQVSSVALTLLIGQAAQLGLSPETVKEWLRTALADADRVRVRSPWLAGRVYTVAARAADLGGDAHTALLFVARARSVLSPGDPSWIATFAIEGAVQMWSGHVDDGIQAYEAAIAQEVAYAGEGDPEVASLYGNYATSLLEVERIEPALRAAERATQIIGQLADPNDDRIDPIRVNLAAVLIGADRHDQALGLLETARANNVRRLGETNTIVANIDSNLATIYNTRGQYDQAIARLESALAIERKLLGAEHTDVAAVYYNLAAAYRYKHDYAPSIAAARHAAQIFASKSAGSDRHRLSLTLAAEAANDGRELAQALELTETALGFARPAENAQTQAWAQLERARALIGVGRPGEARPLLVSARAGYLGQNNTQRVREVDDLLAHLPR